MEAISQNTPHSQQKKPRSWLKIVLLAVTALVVLGVSFTAFAAPRSSQTPTPTKHVGSSPNAPFLLRVTILRQDAKTGERLAPMNDNLMVNPDGSVRGFADGQPHAFTGQFSDGTRYSGMMVFKGSGTYKDGKLSYTEILTSMRITTDKGDYCDLISPTVYEHLEGTFSSSSSNTISGNYNSDSCALYISGTTYQLDAETGTWTGTIVTPGTSA